MRPQIPDKLEERIDNVLDFAGAETGPEFVRAATREKLREIEQHKMALENNEMAPQSDWPDSLAFRRVAINRYFDDPGMCIGVGTTQEGSERQLHLNAELAREHILRITPPDQGVADALINDALTAYQNFSGPVLLLNRDNAGLAQQYIEIHRQAFGQDDALTHLKFTSTEPIPIIPLFDIRPALELGFEREAAIRSVTNIFYPMLHFMKHAQSQNTQHISYDTVFELLEFCFEETDAFTISELIDAATKAGHMDLSIFEEGSSERDVSAEYDINLYVPEDVRELIEQIKSEPLIGDMLDTVADWDAETGQYEENGRPVFDMAEFSRTDEVLVLTTEGLRKPGNRILTFLTLALLVDETTIEYQHQRSTESDYVVNAILDYGGGILDTALVSNVYLSAPKHHYVGLDTTIESTNELLNAVGNIGATYRDVLQSIGTLIVGRIGTDEIMADELAPAGMDGKDILNLTEKHPQRSIARIRSDKFSGQAISGELHSVESPVGLSK